MRPQGPERFDGIDGLDARALSERLSALADDALDPREAAALREMIRRDARLAREFEAMLALRGVLKRGLDPPEVTDEEWSRVVMRAAARQGERLGWWLLAPASLALGVGGVIGLVVDAGRPLWVRIAIAAAAAGLVFLGLSAWIERARVRRYERYDEVER